MCRDVPIDYSLRAYLATIFLDPPMEIILRNKRVEPRKIIDSLAKVEKKRHTLDGCDIDLVLGYSEEEKKNGNGGEYHIIMMIHLHIVIH